MPLLSIVVPTRERADTLFHTLRTLVEQDNQDCEILVSDNASADNTADVVRSFSDNRLRYLNTGSRLSMADNWEFALRSVKGDFVTYIGDDDGFLPDALSKAMRIIEDTKTEALVWDKAEYCWPDYPDPDLRNWISLKSGNHQLQVASSKRRLSKVLRFQEGYTRLPCLYNGLVKTSALRRIAANSTNGAFFNAITPDVFSAIALTTVIKSYLLTEYPFSVNGASRHSNGTAFTKPEGQNAEDKEPTRKFLSENSRTYDARLRMGPSTKICVMGELLLARKFLGDAKLPEPDWNSYLKAMVRNAQKSRAASEILASARYTQEKIKSRVRIPQHTSTLAREMPANTGLHYSSVNFKAPLDMVKNVYDACQLIGGMLPENALKVSASPFQTFAKNMREVLSAEAIHLYRAI